MAVLGHKVSEATREKLRLANLGKKLSTETKKKIGLKSLGNKYARGHKHSQETRNKMSASHTGLKLTDSALKSLIGNKHNLGKKHSDETKIRMSKNRTGNKNKNWKGGITPINRSIRTSKKYKEWRDAIFMRDDYTCQECKARGCVINADHIKPFALYPELRFELSNGRTLCVPCHKKTDTYAGKTKLVISGLIY